MLNALLDGAQRLSASLRSAPTVSTFARRLSSCAQRLSASLRSAQPGHGRDNLAVRVLNACRHHCDQHMTRPPPCSPRPRVLNACRHHCDQHGNEISLPIPRHSVLNACRHHCDQHSPAAPKGRTPAKVLNACRHHCDQHDSLIVPTPHSTRCAQRLSASLRSAQP